MRLSDARALFPALVTQTSEPLEHTRLLRKLADWCQRYTPLIGIDGSDSLWLDITGAAHLQGGENKLLSDLTERLTAIGFSQELGLASTPGAAWAVARFTQSNALPDRNIAPNGIPEALKNMPPDALRLDERATHLLKRFGLRTIGDLLALPRGSLKRRFPSNDLHKAVLHRMDLALGNVAEPVLPLHPPPAYCEYMRCAEPILATESFHHGLQELLIPLTQRMERDLKGATHMTFSAWHSDGGVAQISIGTARPSRDAAHLSYLFRDRIEKINPGFGVDALALAINRIEALQAGQLAFSNRSARPKQDCDVTQLIDRLSNRLGAQYVQRIQLSESHIPERAQRLVPALATNTKPEIDLPSEEQSHIDRTPGPFRLLTPPEPVQIEPELFEATPQKFIWRRMTHRVVRMEGPQRIAPEWWCTDEMANATAPATRDYYRVEDENGRRFWIFHDAPHREKTTNKKPRWHIHGLF